MWNILLESAMVAVVTIALVFLGFLIDFIGSIQFRRLLRRPCAGFRWHRAFPGVEHAQIRRFLAIFAGAFGLRPAQGCYFRPDDRLLDVYLARYLPHLTLDDGLELEMLFEEIERTYSLPWEKFWRDDITLGEIFKRTVR